MSKSHGTHGTHGTSTPAERKMSQLPGWLWPNSNVLSPLYKRIWEAVQENRASKPHAELLVDTNKIFPLLLTSQLSTEILGYIWSLANQKYAGQLTEQELYIVLTLVALAQANYPFNSLEVLNYIRIPPTPNLNLALLDTVIVKSEPKVQSSPFQSPSSNASSSSSKKYVNSARLISKSIPSSLSADSLSHAHLSHPSDLKEVKFSSGHSNHPNATYLDTRQNVYFHSADLKHPSSLSSTVDNDEFSDFQSAPVINNVPTIPNIWDSKQGSAIGSRLANHNLGVKKLNDKVKKTATNKNSNSSSSSTTSSTNQSRSASISYSTTTHGRDLQSSERLSELFPKCTMKSQPKTFILKDTIIRHSDSIEVIKPTAKDIISSVEKPIINKISPSMPKTSYTKTIEPLKESKDTSQLDLMNLQPAEDKYSALRALVDEPPITSFPKAEETLSTSPAGDDFGDFVSARQPEPSTTIEFPPANTNSAQNSIDLLSDFDFNTESVIGTSSKSSPSLIQEISDAFNALALENITVDRQLEEKYNVVLDTEKVIQREDTLSVNSIESNPAVSGILTRSGSVPSLDLKSFLPSSQEDEQLIENMHQMIYWEWKQYMESCVLLLQVAADIFTNITSEIVLREVLQSAQGYNFLCNLAEVAAVCRRVNFSHKEMDINIMGFDDLLMHIDRIWSEMEPFYSNIPIITELPAWPLHPGDGVTCALCLTIISNGRIIFNDNNYHATCANLWLHTVNNNLPVLRYPISYIQSTISQSVNHT